MKDAIYVLVMPAGLISGPMTLEQVNTVCNSSEMTYCDAFICRLVPVDCTGGTLEAEFRESGEWPVIWGRS